MCQSHITLCGFVLLPKKHTLTLNLRPMIEVQNKLEIKPETAIAQNRCYGQVWLIKNKTL